MSDPRPKWAKAVERVTSTVVPVGIVLLILYLMYRVIRD
jgi:hypothetical protein